MKKIFAFILSLSILTGLFFASSHFGLAAASKNLSNSFDGVKEIAGNSGYNTRSSDLVDLIGSIIQTILGLLGVVFMLLTFYAGWLYMTAQGEAKKVDSALEILKSAVIGLIIVLSAYAISIFVIAKLTAKTLTN